jgi:hypothetical protein
MSEHRKQDNRKAHSKKEASAMEPERKRIVVRELK